MDAPIYLPAERFQAPEIAPYALSIRGAPLGELIANKEAWAIVVKHMPMARYLTGQAPWLLATMTLADLTLFAPGSNGLDPKLEAAIDAELARLPQVGDRP